MPSQKIYPLYYFFPDVPYLNYSVLLSIDFFRVE